MERLELADHDPRVAGRGYHHTNGRSVVNENTNAPRRVAPHSEASGALLRMRMVRT